MDWKLLESQLESKLVQVASEIAKQTVRDLQYEYESNPFLFQGNIEQYKLSQDLLEKEREIRRQQEELAVEWKKLNAEKEVSKKIHDLQDTQIKLDVGGKYFSTAIETLTNDPDTMLASMFSGRFPIKKNDEGRVFIDRDGSVFDIILNYLRDGEFSVPKDETVMEKLLKEVRYYGIQSMERMLCGENDNTASIQKYPSALYVVGGTLGGTKTDGVQKYDFRFAKWETAPAMNHSRFSHAVTSYQGKVYAVGGAGLHEVARSAEVLDPEKGSWQPISSMNFGRAKLSLIAAGDKLYAMDTTMEYYDPVIDTWKKLNAKGPGLDLHGVAAWNGNVVVSIGPDIKMFDSRQGTWSAFVTASTRTQEDSRKYHQLVVLGDKLYMVGGYSMMCQPLNTLKYYDIRNSTWNFSNFYANCKVWTFCCSV